MVTAACQGQVVDGVVHRDAARHCADPKAEAANIADRIAFWKDVRRS